jgi:hypothetical protein
MNDDVSDDQRPWSNEISLEVATVVGIDPSIRAAVDVLSIKFPQSRARRIMGRSPDFDSPDVVSWGSVTLDELQRLCNAMTNQEFAQDYLEQITRMINDAANRSARWCLLYRANARV